MVVLRPDERPTLRFDTYDLRSRYLTTSPTNPCIMTERSILIDIARQLHSALGNLQNEDPEDDDDEDQIVCCMKDFLEDEATDDLRQDLDKDHPVSSILDLVEKLVKAHSHREDINAVSTMDDGYDSDVYEEYEEPAATCEDAGGEGGKVHSEDDDKDPHDDDGGDDNGGDDTENQSHHQTFDTYDPPTSQYEAYRASCELELHDQLEIWCGYEDGADHFAYLKSQIADYVAGAVHSAAQGDMKFASGASQYQDIMDSVPGLECTGNQAWEYDPEREDIFCALFDDVIYASQICN